MLSDGATHEAVHLLCRMLVFDPVSSRLTSNWDFICFLVGVNHRPIKQNLVWTDLKSCVGNPSPLFTCRPNGSLAAMPSPTLTWTKAACAITPACVSAATLFPADEFTPATSSRWPSGHSATATRTACCLCGREKVRLCEITVMWPLRVSACHWCASASSTSSSELIHRFITEHQQGKRVPLCINPQSAAFKTFIRWGRVWARGGDDAAHCFRMLYLTKALVPSGPLHGTRPRCPGRRRDERGSSSSRGATAACETISSENTDEFGSFSIPLGDAAGKRLTWPTRAPPDPPHPPPPTNPEYEIYCFTFLTTQTADASRRFRCWI